MCADANRAPQHHCTHLMTTQLSTTGCSMKPAVCRVRFNVEVHSYSATTQQQATKRRSRHDKHIAAASACALIAHTRRDALKARHDNTCAQASPSEKTATLILRGN